MTLPVKRFFNPFKHFAQIVLLILLGACRSAAAAPSGDSVLILVVEFEDGSKEMGTAFVVDHDGLIITADHVLNKYTTTPQSPPFDPGPGKRAKKVTAYSYFLHKKFEVQFDHASSQLVVGSLPNSHWLDIAFFRLRLDEDSRTRLQPLDIATDLPKQADTVYPYGPKCTDPTRSECLQPDTNVTVIGNSTLRAKEYKIGAVIRAGFSGGPLLDVSGRVVGICSYGTTIPFSQQTIEEFYVPATFLLRFYLRTLPPSSFFTASDVCGKIKNLPTLTVFDWQQISAPWVQAPAKSFTDETQCRCCCEAMNKTPNALLYSRFNTSNCTPPFCAEEVLYVEERTMNVEVSHPGPVNTEILSHLYTITRETYQAVVRSHPISADKPPLDVNHLVAIHLSYADTLARIATDPVASHQPQLADAGGYALVAYEESQALRQDADVYGSMSNLLHQQGDTTGATAAELLKDIETVKATDPAAADSAIKALKIDPNSMQKVLDSAVAAKVRADTTVARPVH